MTEKELTRKYLGQTFKATKKVPLPKNQIDRLWTIDEVQDENTLVLVDVIDPNQGYTVTPEEIDEYFEKISFDKRYKYIEEEFKKANKISKETGYGNVFVKRKAIPIK